MKYLIGYTLYIQIAWVIVLIFSNLMKFFLPKYGGEIEEFNNNALTTVIIWGVIFFVLAIAAKIIEVTE